MMMTQPSNGLITSKRKDTVLSPASIKKRRVLEERSQNITITPSPQPLRGMKQTSQTVKSSFEEDLNRLTQEIGEVGDSTHVLNTQWLMVFSTL
jgi:hypothetical protein